MIQAWPDALMAQLCVNLCGDALVGNQGKIHHISTFMAQSTVSLRGEKDMIRYLVPLLLVLAAIILVAWAVNRRQREDQQAPLRQREQVLYLFCIGCAGAALLALALF